MHTKTYMDHGNRHSRSQQASATGALLRLSSHSMGKPTVRLVTGLLGLRAPIQAYRAHDAAWSTEYS